MRSAITILLFAVITCTTAFGQSEKKVDGGSIPDTVLNTFKSKYPAAKDVEWMYGDSNELNARFEQDGLEKFAMFTKEGTWIRTQEDIKGGELPKAVKNSLEQMFNGYKRNNSYKIDDPAHGIAYEVQVEKKKEVYDVIFKPTGEVISKTPVVESKNRKE